jgi:hypothetical protein
VGACGDRQTHYSGGHPIPNSFEVFSEEPLGEIRGILLYLVLPVAIGAIISFMWSYCWNRRSKTETREMPRFAASVLCGTILCWLGYVFSFVDRDVNNWGDRSNKKCHKNEGRYRKICLGATPARQSRAQDIYTMNSQNRLPEWMLYAASLFGVVAKDWWLNELNFAYPC